MRKEKDETADTQMKELLQKIEQSNQEELKAQQEGAKAATEEVKEGEQQTQYTEDLEDKFEDIIQDMGGE